MLVCPVRGCGLPLTRAPGRVYCQRAHSFDIARTGYINLLQPQDRRSRVPGDTPEAVRSRRQLHNSGVTLPLLKGMEALLDLPEACHVFDAGCGDGFYLGSLAQERHIYCHGADLSVAAIESAARRYPACEWIVANVDRAIPYADQSFFAVLSITARHHPKEFHRTLRHDGLLLVAVPAPDDLIELRGAGARNRVPSTVESFSGLFSLKRHCRVTTRAELNADSVRALRHAVYRPMSTVPVSDMSTTFSLDLLLFHPR